MNGDRGDVAQRFAQDLRALRQRAGGPSYSDLERHSKHRLKRATMSDVLNGHRVNLPDWRFVSAFVAACHAAAAETGGVNLVALGTVDDWKRHWDVACSGTIGVRYPGQEQPWENGADPASSSRPEAVPGAPSDSAAAAGGGKPAVWGRIPPRLPDFVGRPVVLTEIRRLLATATSRSLVTIQGMPGSGKTQLAVEYAYQYASEYDLVWWVPGDSLAAAHRALARLADRLGLAPGPAGSGESGYDLLFDALRRREPHKRWLLVLDNAIEPEPLAAILPPVGGHVLVTSRSSGWGATGGMLELDVFDRAESVEFLRRRRCKISEAAAQVLADAVGDLPLLLAHWAESRLTVDEYIARLERDPLGLLDDQPSDYQGTIIGEWRAIHAGLGGNGHEALDLLACLCWFGDKPVPREAVERRGYLEGISTPLFYVLHDSLRRTVAMRALGRAGVVRVRGDGNPLEVHRVTRRIMRALMNLETGEGAERSRHDVHLLLAGADPLDPEAPANWRDYRGLHGHATQSRAAGCDDEPVRRLIVNLTRYLTATGDPWAALRLADDALAQWEAAAVEDGPPRESRARLALQQAKAVALLACGQPHEALRLQRETLDAMRAASGPWEREVAFLGRLSGAYERMTGDFRAAQAADQEAEREQAAQFVDYHPHLYPALNNVIANLLLGGRHEEAVRAARSAYHDCQMVYNDDRHPTVLFQRNVLGRCLWLGGQYDEAVAVLTAVRAGYHQAALAGTIEENHPWRLEHEVDLAVARRDQGQTPAELAVLAADLYHVRRRCWWVLGADHGLTLAATVALASVLRGTGEGRAAADAVSEAADELTGAAQRYASVLADHPYTHACRGQTAAVRYLAGLAGETGAGAVQVLGELVVRLTEQVGAEHPLALAVACARVVVAADAAESDWQALGPALQLAEQVLAGYQAWLGPAHPYALACEANVATIRHRMHQVADPAELLDRLTATVGPDHPYVRLLRGRALIIIDFTPLPL
jgi:hypothetical protein